MSTCATCFPRGVPCEKCSRYTKTNEATHGITVGSTMASRGKAMLVCHGCHSELRRDHVAEADEIRKQVRG